MTQYKVSAWEYGGLVIAERHIIQEKSFGRKSKNAGQWSKWKNIKWPTNEGVGRTLLNLFMSNGDYDRTIETPDEIIEVVEDMLRIQKELSKSIVENMGEIICNPKS